MEVKCYHLITPTQPLSAPSLPRRENISDKLTALEEVKASLEAPFQRADAQTTPFISSLNSFMVHKSLHVFCSLDLLPTWFSNSCLGSRY